MGTSPLAIVCAVAVCAVVGCGGDSPSSPTTFSDRQYLSYTIEGRVSREWTPENTSRFSYGADPGPVLDTVHIDLTPLTGSFVFLRLSAPQGRALSTGLYRNVRRFETTDAPALDLQGVDIGCPDVEGNFSVDVLEWSANPRSGVGLERFHATFALRCVFSGVGPSGPRVTGEINIP